MNAIGARQRPPVFVARGLTKIYRMGEVEVRALSDLELEIGEGEFVVMLGPSGSGKSTLLNHYSVGRYDMAPTLLSKIIPQRSAYSASR